MENLDIVMFYKPQSVFSRRHEASNRPSLLRTTDMKQSASQMWCLIRFLPQLIGGQVPTDQPEWAVFLTLRTIMDIVFAPKLTEDVTYTLDGLIDEHHTMFQEVCNEIGRFAHDNNICMCAVNQTIHKLKQCQLCTWCIIYEFAVRYCTDILDMHFYLKSIPSVFVKEIALGREIHRAKRKNSHRNVDWPWQDHITPTAKPWTYEHC